MRRSLIFSLLLISMTWIVFWQVRDFDFVSFDDTVYITQNPHLTGGLNRENIRWAFTTVYAAFYHPLTWLSYFFDIELSGGDAAGFHVANLVWHTVNVVLVFLLLQRMTGDDEKSAIVAALFAIHPLHVESVAWIAERKDVLSTFFGLLTLYGYTRYAQSLNKRWYVFVFFAYLCSLLSKSMLITLPFLLLLLDFWPLRRAVNFCQENGGPDFPDAVSNRKDVSVAGEAGRDHVPVCSGSSWKNLLFEKIPLFLLSFVFCLLTFFTQAIWSENLSFTRYSLMSRACNALNVYVIYLWKMFWPRELTVYYAHPGKDVSLMIAACSLLLLVAITTLVLSQIRKRPYLFVGWFWYLGTLLPVIGFVQIWTLKMADRFTYFPLIGLFICLAWGVPSLLKSIPYRTQVLSVVGVSILFAFSAIAYVQTGVWQNSITLFQHALRVSDEKMVFYNQLGAACHEAGRLDEAAFYYTQVVRQFPKNIEGHVKLGSVLNAIGKNDLAIQHFEKAVSLHPESAEEQYLLGTVLAEHGELEKAILHLNESVRLDPEHAMAHTNLGFALQKSKKIDKAIKSFQHAVRLEPQNNEFYLNLGDAYFDQERYELAIQSYQRALVIGPPNARAYNNLGVVFQADGQFSKAIEYYQRALEIAPDLLDAQRNLQQLRQKESGRSK